MLQCCNAAAPNESSQQLTTRRDNLAGLRLEWLKSLKSEYAIG